MHKLIGSLVVSAVFAASVHGADSDAPDFSSMDQATLAYLAEQQHEKIEMLKAEIEDLKAQIAGGHGGSEAVVVGDITSVTDGSWVVTISSVAETDVSLFKQQIEDYRLELNGRIIPGAYNRAGSQSDGIEDRLRQAEQDVNRLATRGKYKNTVTSKGRTVSGSSNLDGYTDKEMNAAKAAVRRLQGEKRGVDRKILELERRIEAARNTITAQGTTDDGVPVTLTAAGVYAQIGRSFEQGKAYTVTGRGQFNASSGEITVKTAVEQVDASTEAGE